MKEKSPGLDARVRAHYEVEQKEEERLSRGPGRSEFLRTLELLGRFLPPPPPSIIDVGGGAGAYALPLAKQ